MKFKSKRERYDWMVKHSPEMVEFIAQVKEAFGDIKLSNVGFSKEIKQ